MKTFIKGALIGGVLGIAAPIAIAVGNEAIWASTNRGGITKTQICFAERHWRLFELNVVHAKGCHNKILESAPYCLLIGVFGGSLVGALTVARKPSPNSSTGHSPESIAPHISTQSSDPAKNMEAIQTSFETQNIDSSMTASQESFERNTSSISQERNQKNKEGAEFRLLSPGKIFAIATIAALAGVTTFTIISAHNKQKSKIDKQPPMGSWKNGYEQICYFNNSPKRCAVNHGYMVPLTRGSDVDIYWEDGQVTTVKYPENNNPIQVGSKVLINASARGHVAKIFNNTRGGNTIDEYITISSPTGNTFAFQYIMD